MLDFGSIINAAVRAYMDNSARSIQSEEGIIGPSDIGFCRQKAVLMTRGIPQTDSVSKWPAAIGTALHNFIEGALAEMFPDWILGSIHGLEVTATMPSGAKISGHPDIVIPSDNTLLDIKTTDGLALVRRDGSSQSNRYQRHIYVMGCIEKGLLDPSKPIYVGNIYFDRSGEEADPYCIVEEFDPTLTDQIDSWITDVIYAVEHNEEAMRDVPAPVCEKICTHYSACRGDLPISDDTEFISDATLIAAVEAYNDAREMEKEAKRIKDEASSVLSGVNGTTGKWTVRWTQVNSSRIEAFERAGYLRLDIRPTRK